jgi:parvulin-like peptidyl-prolyl isomerase
LPGLAALLLLNLALWGWLLASFSDPLTIMRTGELLEEITLLREEHSGELVNLLPPHRQEQVHAALSHHPADPDTLAALLQDLQRLADQPLPPHAVERLTRDFRAQFTGETHYLRELARSGVTETQLAYWLRENQTIAQRHALRDQPITPEAIARFYHAHPEIRQLPELRRARHIFLIAPRDITEPEVIRAREVRIREISRRLDAGEDFATLAQEHSEDEATRAQGGLLPLFTLEQLPPVLRQQMSRLHPGDVAGPFYEPELGWHLVRLEEIIPARQAGLEEMKPFIRQTLRNHHRAAAGRD